MYGGISNDPVLDNVRMFKVYKVNAAIALPWWRECTTSEEVKQSQGIQVRDVLRARRMR